MVRLISRQRGGLAALKLTKLFGIDDFPAAKDSGKVLIIIIYCYLIIIIEIRNISDRNRRFGGSYDIIKCTQRATFTHVLRGTVKSVIYLQALFQRT